MRVIILTQYYPPETGAPQNRLHELGIELRKLGVEVSVLTAMPNYPQMKIYDGYKGKLFGSEVIDEIEVFRSWIFTRTGSGIITRLLNYFSFVLSSFFRGLFLKRSFDYMICESPPLFLGISAIALSKIKNWPLIFNVSDLWPESAEKLGIVTNKRILKITYWLEQLCYNNSILVTGQTKGIVENIKMRNPTKDVYWLPNGVDLDRYKPDKYSMAWRYETGFSKDDIILLYAGIIGHAQGLEIILDAADKMLGLSQVKFVLIGEGPEKIRLQQLKNDRNLANVFFLPGVPKSKMGDVLKSIDIALVPLKKLDLFLGAIPSKIFEALAMEKPILLGVDGESKEMFIDKGICGWYFEPENANELSNRIKKLLSNPEDIIEKGKNGRIFVNENFDRKRIAKGLFDKLNTKMK